MTKRVERKIGIFTGGGDCPGLNAVIRAAVTVGTRLYGFEVLGIEDALRGLVDLEYRRPNGNMWLTPEGVRDILDRGGTILGTANRSDPFNYVTAGPDGQTSVTDVSDRIVENYHRLGLEGLISIGGDGSMRLARRLEDKGLPLVGVPKTIDNDLAGTDVTFGFDTAVETATQAVDRIRDTARSHDRVMLVEVMGRDAGHIALHAGLAGGANAILIPEIPYQLGPLIEMTARKRDEHQTHAVVVVAEGARPAGDSASEVEAQPGEMPRLVGAAQRLAEALQPHLENEVRLTVLGHLQRGGSPSGRDRILATRFGRSAASLVAAGQFGRMVALRGDRVASVPIEEAIAAPKLVDVEGELVATARDMGIVFGDEDGGA